MDLKKEPVLGRAQFLLNPDAPESLNELEGYLTHCAMRDIAGEMAAAEGVEYLAYVESRTEAQVSEIYERALDRVFPTITKLQGLAERVSRSVAYKIMRREVHKKLGENGSFLHYLQTKLEADPGDKTLEEIVFFLEVIEYYESISRKHGFSQEIFSNPVVYGKMVASISTLKKKFNALKTAEALLKDQEEDINSRIKVLRSARSDARVRGEAVDLYDTAIEEAKDELEVLKEKSAEPIENLETVFVAYTQAAVDIAQSPIDRSLVASSLPKVAQMKLKSMGKDPAKVSKEFDEAQADKSKPVAYTIHADNEVIVTFKVRSRFFKVIQSLFEGTFDVRIGTIEDGQKLLNGFTNPNKGK